MTFRWLAAALIALAATVSTAHAQGGPPSDRAAKRLEMIRLWKLTEVLDLNDDELAKLMPTLKDYYGKLEAKAREREDALRSLELQAMQGKTPEAASVKADIKKVLDAEKEITEIRLAHYEKMSKMLTANQLARYMIFEVRFHDEVQNMVSDFRQRRGMHGRGRFMNRPGRLPPDDDAGDTDDAKDATPAPR